VEAAPVQHLPVILDAERVLADQQVAQLGDGGAHGLGAALDHRLAPAGDPLIGLDAQEQPPWRHQEGTDVRDLHVSSRSPASAWPASAWPASAWLVSVSAWSSSSSTACSAAALSPASTASRIA